MLSEEQAATVLSRLGYGPRRQDVVAVREAGIRLWIEGQLKAPDVDDPEVAARLASLRLQIRYPAGPGTPGNNGVIQNWLARDEGRPLGSLDLPIKHVWPLVDHGIPIAPQERAGPRDCPPSAPMAQI